MLTISQLARRFGLSRSTLLYYDSIGLLSPSARSDANYRLYSRNDIERMERVIPLFIRRVSNDEAITIYGKDKVLDFTYVDDCISGISLGIEALVSEKVANETINLAYGEGFTLLAMTDFIAEALGVEPNVTLAEPLVGEVTHYIADITKATELLGFKPQVPLAEGIKRSVAWQKEWMKS